MKQERTALYAGSFDPLTNGHLDVIRRAARLFDWLIVAIGANQHKQPIFSLEDRTRHLQGACRELTNVRVASFSGLLTRAVRDFEATAVVRGLRAVSDFEWELQMALMNRELESSCETVFLMPSPEYSFISSTLIREICQLGGDISAFVPEPVAGELGRKYRQAGTTDEESGSRI